MPWIRFSADFDWSPPAYRNRVTIAYKAGMVQLVTRACADKATAKGAASPTKRPLSGKRKRRAIQEID